jgi:PAS domain S-box-containing protein
VNSLVDLVRRRSSQGRSSHRWSSQAWSIQGWFRRDQPGPGLDSAHAVRTLALTGAVLVFALLAGATWVVLDRRTADLAAAEHENDSLSAALAEQTSRTFGAVDFLLSGLLERIHAAGVTSPEALAATMGTNGMQRMLRDQVLGLGQIDVVSVVAANGRLINFSRQWPVLETMLADRDYFRSLRDDPSLDRFIGVPVASRGTGLMTIYLARRISAPDGRFLGAVLGSVRLDYFIQLYRAVSQDQGQTVGLRRRDGALLARYPDPGTSRQSGPDPETFAAAQAGIQLSHSLSASRIDGKLRLRTTRALVDFPLVVVVARDEAAILADWRRQTFAIAVGTALSALALIVAVALFARQIAHRETSEAALAATLDHMSQGIMMIDADQRVPVHNRRVLEMLDLPLALMARKPPFEDILRFQWARGEFGPDGTGVEDAVRQFILSGGISHELNFYERRRPDGTVLEVRSIPLTNGGSVRTYTDVTVARAREAALLAALHERDGAETALRQHRDDLEHEVAARTRALAASEARHRDVAEVASDWFWETDAQNRLTFLSDRFRQTSGIAPEQIVGSQINALLALGMGQDGQTELMATIDAHETFHDIVRRVLLPGPEARYWRMSGKPFNEEPAGAFAGYRGTGTDVTAAIEREAALTAALRRTEDAEREARRMRARLIDAIETIPQGIVVFDAEDRLVLCNSRYTEMYPLTADLMTPGISFADILRASAVRGEHILNGQDIEEWLAGRVTRHRASGGNREERRLANGRWLQTEERRTSDGGTVGIRVDVTEARQREAAERDREKLAALGQLAGGVAHEINNLLQPALALPELVRDRLPLEDTESREDLDCVLEGVRKVRDIVRNILLFARKEEPRLASLALVTEIRAALAFLRDLIPPSITIREDDLDLFLDRTVAANKTQLTQVLTNLLVNAAQATSGTGSVTVSLARADPTADAAAELGIEAGRGYLAVSIADTGSGMDSATQARIFEPFFTTKPVGQGTGLGLSVVYGILRSWQGAITVRSALGQGTTFVLYLPEMHASDA